MPLVFFSNVASYMSSAFCGILLFELNDGWVFITIDRILKSWKNGSRYIKLGVLLLS